MSPTRALFVACLAALAVAVLASGELAQEVKEVKLCSGCSRAGAPRYATAPLGLGVKRVATPRGHRGDSEIDEQIVGGKDAHLGDFPHQVSMQVSMPGTLWLNTQPQHICGGTLIARQWVLTAAHCVYGVPNSATKVEAVLGIDNLAVKAKGSQRILVSRMLVHSKYDHYANTGVGPFDIAMLKLARPAKLSDNTKLANLPEADSVQTGDAALSGWGSTSSNGNQPIFPEQLQMATFPVVPYKECLEFARGVDPDIGILLKDTNLCVGPIDTTGLSSCSGDSGGPLVQTNGDTTTVIGVVSWGWANCGAIPFPSIFTRVSAYNAWIQAVQDKY